jgi:hypothetical protein
MTPVGRSARAAAASRTVGTVDRFGALLLGTVLALVVASALVVADPSPPPAAAAGCGPAPEGRVAVVVVIDHGGASTPSSRCVVVDHGATGLDALRAAGHQVRLDGGFVCAIDARPATGCGNRPGSPYWRYWHAAPGGSWDYSQVGAGGYRLPARCAVEGWSWSDSPTSQVPPRVAAPRPTCEAAPPTTAPPVRPAAPVPPATPSTPTGPGATAAPGVANEPDGGVAGSSDTGPSTSGAPTTAVGEASDGDDRAGEAGRSDDTGPDPADSAGSTDPDSDPDADERAGGPDDLDGELAADPGGAGGADGGSTPWGVLIAVVLVAALAAASVLRTRARRQDPTSPSV